jgi:prepilin-type N-terminal cleavage/methylation domain-containing protein
MSPVCVPPTRPRRGFTLLELLITIFIIGILIASTLTIVTKVKRAVYQAETQAQLSALSNAIQQYYNDYKAYPGPLANIQLCANYESGAPNAPYSSSATPTSLSAVNIPATVFPNQNYNPGSVLFQANAITSSQNLVLGLLGGLEMVQQQGGSYLFEYNAQDIFSDGSTPAPRGPASLNVTNPRRQQAYIQVKPGEISTPSVQYNSGAGASFVDGSQDFNSADGRSPTDAMIPVFLDKYSDPLPILYYRTNIGAPAIVGFRNFSDSTENTKLSTTDSNGNVTLVTAQYDLVQNIPYPSSMIGTVQTKNIKTLGQTNATSLHGLTGITSAANATAMLLISEATPSNPPADPIDYTANGRSIPTNNGSNGLAYFKDPTLNSTTYDGTTSAPSNVHLGVARQKDGYLLISAGPDRLYGTHDDLVFPGTLQP